MLRYTENIYILLNISWLFWNFTQRRLMACYRCFWTNYQSTLRNTPKERMSQAVVVLLKLML